LNIINIDNTTNAISGAKWGAPSNCTINWLR
jgi:hypothetical protein